MNRTLDKVAAGLALTIGGLAVIAGGQVLLGRSPGWNVISWLPVYNFVVGVLTIFVVAPMIWRGSRYALPAAFGMFGANAVVAFVLQIAFQDVVARESMMAMFFRLGVWLIILFLMFLQLRRRSAMAGDAPG